MDGTTGSLPSHPGRQPDRTKLLNYATATKTLWRQRRAEAVSNVNTKIAKLLIGKNVFDQRGIDDAMRILDGTVSKRRLGANAILGVSLACAHAGAKAKRMPLYRYLRWVFDLENVKAGKPRPYKLPYPTMNIMNGGVHAGWAIDLQECMIIPQQKKFAERLRCGAEVFHALKSLLTNQGYATTVGDEGGFAVKWKSNEEALKVMMRAVVIAGYNNGRDVKLGMDPAASEFYDASKKIYNLKADGKRLTSDGMIKMYASWAKKYPLVMIEDGLAEDDWAGWKKLTETLGKSVTLVGDDLFVTNVERLQKGIKMNIANAVLIKVNQIGTLSETIDTILLAQQHRYKIVVSHRSGETEDTTIADLAVAVNAEHIKTGSLSRSERLAKYNRLLEIEEELS